jgi:hypothetical protein
MSSFKPAKSTRIQLESNSKSTRSRFYRSSQSPIDKFRSGSRDQLANDVSKSESPSKPAQGAKRRSQRRAERSESEKGSTSRKRDDKPTKWKRVSTVTPSKKALSPGSSTPVPHSASSPHIRFRLHNPQIPTFKFLPRVALHKHAESIAKLPKVHRITPVDIKRLKQSFQENPLSMGRVRC